MSSTAVFTKASPLDALQNWLPKLVLAPSMLIVLVGFYGYILWTFLLSFTNSSFMPLFNQEAIKGTDGRATLVEAAKASSGPKRVQHPVDQVL